MKELRLRGHHFTWLSDFYHLMNEGATSGLDQYNEDFQHFLRNLDSHRDLPVTLVEGSDDICLNCVYYSGQGCADPRMKEDYLSREARIGIDDKYIADRHYVKRFRTLGDVLEL